MLRSIMSWIGGFFWKTGLVAHEPKKEPELKILVDIGRKRLEFPNAPRVPSAKLPSYASDVFEESAPPVTKRHDPRRSHHHKRRG